MLADTETISFLPMLDNDEKHEEPRLLHEIMEEKRQAIMDEEWHKQGRLGNIREYVLSCTLRFDKELEERYDERDDERLEDEAVIDNCFYCGKPITAGMMRSVDAISYSWTHKDGTPVTARCCWGDCDTKTEKDLHTHYLRLCGLTEEEYREELKREQPTVWKARVEAGWYEESV